MTIPWTLLMQSARAATANCHIPYSHYPVGAALLADDGSVWTGVNIENASYGLTNCAERTAVFKAVSEGKRHFLALVICGGTADSPAHPCGACRQVLAEFCPPDMPVRVIPLLPPAEESPIDHTLAEYLPCSFHLDSSREKALEK